MDPLLTAARHGPWVLVAGLCVGLALPGLAEAMRPLLPVLVLCLLFVSVLRIPPRALLGTLPDLPKVLGTALALQLAVPLTVIALAHLTGQHLSATALALTLMWAAPSIMGSPNISMMLGASPDHGMRLMVAGTSLLPLTIIPVFWLSPALGDMTSVRTTALTLTATIGLTGAAAIATRALLLSRPTETQQKRLEGASAIALAVFVIGLMPQVSTVAISDPVKAIYWAAVAFGANFGAQILVWRLTRARQPRDRALPISLIAGNRNIALFLVSLPPETTAPIMVFIGCYQLPMYLTPLLLRSMYRS